MRLEILLTAMLFFVGALLLGYALCRILKLKKEGFLFSIVSGTMFAWSLMELILVPMTMKFASFQSFVLVYSIVILVFCVLGLFSWKDMIEDGRCFFQGVRQYFNIGYILAFGLMCYQLYFIHHHMYLEWDDAYYVNLANEAVFSNKIYWVYPETGAFADFDKRYVLSLWPIFYAWLSKLLGVSPTIMAHTILPWILIPLTYMVYVLIAKWLFSEDTDLQGMFVCFVVLLHLFMSGQHTSGITFLSITPWVGKGLLASLLLPTIFYLILRTTEQNNGGDWVLLGITALAACLLSSMGIMLTPLFIGMAICLLSLYKKSVHYLWKGIVACSPCLILGIYYIYLVR